MSRRADADRKTLERELATQPQLDLNRLTGAGVPTVRRARRALAAAVERKQLERHGMLGNRRWVPTPATRKKLAKAAKKQARQGDTWWEGED